jgi:putative flippase GtrA
MIQRELGIFLVIGLLTVLIDYLFYRAISWTGAVGSDAAKGMGFLAGTVFAYFANRHWTFGHAQPGRGSPGRFALLYLATLGANVAVNEVLLRSPGGMGAALQLAFLVATGTSATLNFLGMKWFVFRPTVSKSA